jgi:hypothetical protein
MKQLLDPVKVDRHFRGFDPEPRLISDTITAFHDENIRRAKYLVTSPTPVIYITPPLE